MEAGLGRGRSGVRGEVDAGGVVNCGRAGGGPGFVASGDAGSGVGGPLHGAVVV